MSTKDESPEFDIALVTRLKSLLGNPQVDIDDLRILLRVEGSLKKKVQEFYGSIPVPDSLDDHDFLFRFPEGVEEAMFPLAILWRILDPDNKSRCSVGLDAFPQYKLRG